MAFKPVPKPPQFADLKGILSQSKETDNPLYQVVQEIIERLTQLDLVKGEQLKAIEKRIETVTTIITPPAGEELPALHAITHEPGGSDPLTVDAAPAVGSLRTLGPGANQAAPGNDTRFTDPSPPLAHAATHQAGGSDKILAIEEAVITDANILARIAADETISGGWAFTGGATRFQHVNPVQFQLLETDGPANEKWWRVLLSVGEMLIQGLDDSFAGQTTLIKFTRNGTTLSNIEFYIAGVLKASWDTVGLNQPAGVRFSGQVAVSVGADQTAWNPTGLGTNFLLVVTPSQGGLNIRGILAQPAGTLLCLYFNTTLTVNFTFEDGSATVTNRLTLPGGVTLTTVAYQSITFIYDTVGGGRWRLIANSSQ